LWYKKSRDSYLADIEYYNEALATLDLWYKKSRDSYLADIEYYSSELATLDSWYTEQIDLLDSSYQQALEMYNAVLGVDNTIEGGFESVSQALDALAGAIGSMGPASNSGGSSGRGGVDLLQQLRDYGDQFGGHISWGDGYGLLTKDLENLTPDQLERVAEGIPGFANGGFHTGGWRIVGEEGPELEYTPPSRIYSNPDSSDMFDMSELVAEVKQLSEDMRSANYAIAKNTQKTAKTLEKFDYDGLPEQRVV
jgi:hypothetical protein